MGVLTLEIVTFAIHEDVVHEHHAEHAGVDVEVAEDEREVGRLRGRDSGFMANQDNPALTLSVCPPLNPSAVPRVGTAPGDTRGHFLH